MKTLYETIEEVKSGGRPDYEELRFALLAMDGLRFFDSSALTKLWERERDGKYNAELFGLKFEAEETFNRTKRALDVPPKQWVEETNNPDNPEYQKRREVARKIFNKMLKEVKTDD